MSTNPYLRTAQIRPQFLKVPEVAEMHGVKPRTIYEMVEECEPDVLPGQRSPATANPV